MARDLRRLHHEHLLRTIRVAGRATDDLGRTPPALIAELVLALRTLREM